MKNIYLTIAIVLSAAIFVKADFFPNGTSASTYVDNGTGLDVSIAIGWGTNTFEFGDGFVVTLDGMDYCIEGPNTGAYGDPNCAFFGLGPSTFGDFQSSPTLVTVTIPYPAGWAAGDPVDILIDGYGDGYGAAGDDSIYTDEAIQSTEFEAPPPPVSCSSGVEPDEFLNTGQAPDFLGIVSSTFIDGGAPVSVFCADDFVVGAGGTALVGILAYGKWSDGGGATVTDVTAEIYTDAGGTIGPAVCTYTEVPTSVGGLSGADIGIQFSSPCVLTMGTYWISVQVNGTARWNWLLSAGQQGAEGQIIDSADVFGTGFTDWTPFSDALGISGDMGFVLYNCEEDALSVPTLSQWSLTTLALMLMTLGALKIGQTNLRTSRQLN